MELNERKIRILEYIINDYIATAEPVGSRTIAKKYDIKLSPATIRNEMSDLEEMGYILAPHASAGRVPSDKGYRVYVDRLMKRRTAEAGSNGLSGEERLYLQNVVNNNIDRIDYLMRETAKAISLLTNYTTVVSETVSADEKLQHLQLLPLDESSVVLVTVTGSKKVKNHALRVSQAPDYEELMRLSAVLNSSLRNRAVGDMDQASLARLKEAFASHEGLLASCLSVVGEILDDTGDHMVFTSGIKNILTFPEFSDLDKARAVFDALEAKDSLVMLLGGPGITGSVHEEGIDIIIGQENSELKLKDCSIIRASYTLGGEDYGGIAILGPTRMDYSQAVNVLQSIVRHIDTAIRKLET